MQLQVAHINPSSYVDGPGQRAVLYLAGCPIRCPGCQSPHLWPEDAGIATDVDEVAARLRCRGCGAEYAVKSFFEVCPTCGSLDRTILSGQECEVQSVEVPDE